MKNNKGYTLVELLVSMVVLMMVLTEVYIVMNNGSNVYNKGSYDVSLQTKAQQALMHLEDILIDANESVPEKRSERTENESGRNDNNETIRKELEGRPETIEQFRPDESDQGLQHDDHNIPDRQEHPGDWQSSPPQDGSNNGTFPDVHEDGREQENMRGDQPYGGQNTPPDGPPH